MIREAVGAAPRIEGGEVLLLPAEYVADRLSRGPSLQAGAGEGCGIELDDVGEPLLDAVGELGSVLGDRLAPVFQVADGSLDLAATLAQFTLDTHARFAHLALEAFAGGDAAALEAAQLGLGPGRRRVAGN